jgi:GST-like protein
MIDLYSWTTPNGRKISIALEEMGLEYKSHAIDITKDEQFAPDFLKISPNNRIPAIVDGDTSIFESEYSEQRYHAETLRLYGVLDRHLATSPYIISTLSIADFATWPWASRFEYHQVDLNDFPNVKRWYLELAARPAFARGYAQPKDAGPIPLP